MADKNAKELALLKAAIARGLSPEEVEGIEFESQRELDTQLDLRQQRKEIEELKKSFETVGEGRSGPSDPRIDTGGPTGDAATKRASKVQGFRTKAKELKANRFHREAVWLALRAAHADPEKYMPLRPGENDED